jgi:sensor domain CHASE-containing protein
MRLSRKIITLILITFAITVLTVTFISKTFLLNHFVTLEINKADSGVSRIIKYIHSDVGSLNTLAMSYGHWDETYNYITNRSSSYIDNNYTDLSTFSSVDTNFIIIAGADGTPLFIKTINVNKEQELDEFELKGISKRLSSLLSFNKLTTINGVYMTYKGPLLLSCQPITDSLGQKPTNGYYILAKYLDKGEISEISTIIGENFTIHNYISADFLSQGTGIYRQRHCMLCVKAVYYIVRSRN